MITPVGMYIMRLLYIGSKCQCVCDVLSTGGCVSCNKNSKQSADRWTNVEGIARYDQVLQSLPEEHSVFKAGTDTRFFIPFVVDMLQQ